jgi:hypothetical protein
MTIMCSIVAHSSPSVCPVRYMYAACVLALQVRIVLKLLRAEHVGYELQGVRALFDARCTMLCTQF